MYENAIDATYQFEWIEVTYQFSDLAKKLNMYVIKLNNGHLAENQHGYNFGTIITCSSVSPCISGGKNVPWFFSSSNS